jgi:hypothetical protein
MARLGRNLERAAARPGLSIMATEDHLAGIDQQRLGASARAALRSQSSTDGLTDDSPKIHNEVLRRSTASGRERDESDPDALDVVTTREQNRR